MGEVASCLCIEWGPTHLHHCHVSLKIRALESQLAASQARVAELERDAMRDIEERDHREDQITRIARALGVTEEWSNNHDLGELALARAETAERERDRLRSRYTCVRESGAICPCQSCMYERATRFERERDEAVARAEKAIDLLSQWSENDNDGLGPDGDLLDDTAAMVDAPRPTPTEEREK